MILLSMLGTNDYKEVAYTWGDKKALSSKFFQAALAGWFPQANVLICVTKEARDKHEQAVKQLLPSAQLVDIPSGKKEAEYWEIFNTLEQHIPTGAELVFDVTHGFRSLPTLALLVVSFLRAAKAVQLKHVLYGAYEARTGDTAPVFDLTPFMTMLDWASATNRFLDTGYPQKLAQVALSEDKYKIIASSLTDFSHAMQLHDPIRAGQEAKKALDALQKDFGGPMEILRGRLQKRLEPLVFTKEDEDEKQLRAIWAQVDWYLEHQHYEKAVGLAKEWLYLFARWKSGKGIWPEDKSFSLNTFLSKQENSELREIDNNLRSLRNSMMHWRGIPTEEGILAANQAPFESQIQVVQDLLKRLKSKVIQMGLELPEVP
ncbi:MAG: hypothetical protein KatS3mg074_115 [Meiothermus sp.]|nr:MAG: hypothetical protein KatS3mg074_115 [Meiothermus sp.]